VAQEYKDLLQIVTNKVNLALRWILANVHNFECLLVQKTHGKLYPCLLLTPPHVGIHESANREESVSRHPIVFRRPCLHGIGKRCLFISQMKARYLAIRILSIRMIDFSKLLEVVVNLVLQIVEVLDIVIMAISEANKLNGER